ncbi:MAG: HD domain-containing protein [Lachnospiraceae bacterium]|jgi:3'-5' exoribonuclease|nr:HD domain-containing protein [Lachnospiraceae bacterium]
MRYINTLQAGETIRNVYLCRGKRSAETKTKKPYDSLILSDKTGSLDGKIWEPGSPGIEDYKEQDFIEVTGDVINYNNNLQLNIRKLRVASKEDYVLADYLSTTDKNPDEMFNELIGFIDQIENPYLKAGVEFFFLKDEAFIKKFKAHSAAKTMHHSFSGGLLEHTLSIMRLCAYMTKAYPILNKDLLFASALCHDIGKTRELSPLPENDYTDEGQLIGHIVIGIEMLDEAINSIPDFPPILAYEWKHCIVAHHGEFEFGSPKKPAIVEAMALHLADDMDAKMQMFKEILKEKQGEDWLGYNKALVSNIRRTT